MGKLNCTFSKSFNFLWDEDANFSTKCLRMLSKLVEKKQWNISEKGTYIDKQLYAKSLVKDRRRVTNTFFEGNQPTLIYVCWKSSACYMFLTSLCRIRGLYSKNKSFVNTEHVWKNGMKYNINHGKFSTID